MSRGRVAAGTSRFLRRYLRAPTLSVGAATTYLRAAYALAFLVQCLVAALVGVSVLALAGGGSRQPNTLLAWALALLALSQLPIMLFVVARFASFKSAPGARAAALRAALLAGVLLASTAWYLALALATGQVGVPLYLLLALTLTAYTTGFLLVGRLGRVAAGERIREDPPGE